MPAYYSFPSRPTEIEYRMSEKTDTNIETVKTKLLELFDDMLGHDGFGDIKVEMKILKRQQKEVILHCGKQYRFVIDNPNLSA